MNRALAVWLALRSSLWFVPALLVTASVGLALALVEAQPFVHQDLAARWPRLFGAGAEGARGMLGAIATSMITVAGVVFSVTIVALAQTSSQYSPRVLRNFMGDRPTQIVLGAFVAVFTYCLIVLRTIRSGDEGGFVPSLAVLGGVVMAFVGVGLLIYFIHHVATAIQVSFIVARIAAETRVAIDRLFPAEAGGSAREVPAGELDGRWDAGRSCEARRTGYVLAVDTDRLMTLAARHDLLLRVRPRIGDFVVEGDAILDAVRTAGDDGIPVDALRLCIAIADERDIHQDAAHGLQQLCDIALKALSASVHDPSTASGCIDQIGALLSRAACRPEPSPWREQDGQVRLLVHGTSFGELVELALSPLIHHAGSHEAVHQRLLGVLERLGALPLPPRRRAVVLQRLESYRSRLGACDLPAATVEGLRQRIARVERRTKDGSEPGAAAPLTAGERE